MASAAQAIEADGFLITARIDFKLDDDRAETVARSTGIGMPMRGGRLPTAVAAISCSSRMLM